MSRPLKIFIIICLLFIAALPTLISTSWGTKGAVATFNLFASGKLTCEKAQLNWVGTQHIERLEYVDNKGTRILSVSLFDTKTSLLYLLFGGRTFGATLIENPYLLVSNKEAKESSGGDKAHWPTFGEALTLHNGFIQLGTVTLSKIEIEKPNIYTLHAITQGDGITGEINLGLSSTEITGKVNNFPIALLDQLDRSTFYTDALGSSLNLNFQLEKQAGAIHSVLAKIESKNLNGTLEGHAEGDKFYLNSTSQLTLSITPKFINSLLPENVKREWQLVSPAHLTLHIMKGAFPLSLNHLNYKDIVLQAHGEVDRAELKHETLSNYSLNNFTLDIVSSHNLNITYRGDIQGKEASSLKGEISIAPNGATLFQTQTKGFPVSLLGLLSPPLEEMIQKQIGPFFDFSMEGTYQDKKLDSKLLLTSNQMRMEGTLKGKLPNLDFDFQGDRIIAGKTAAYIGNGVDFQFNGAAHISKEEISIPHLNGTLLSPYYRINLKGAVGKRIDLTARGELLKLPFNEEYPQVTLRNGEFSIKADTSSNKITGRWSINTGVVTDAAPLASKGLQGRFDITDFIQDETFDFEKADYSFNCSLDGLPVALLDPLLPGDWDLAELLGPTLKIQASGSYTPTQEEKGTIDLQAEGEGLDASFSLAIDGTLKVSQNKQAYIHWMLTPARYHSLVTTLRADHPPLFQLTKQASLNLTIHELTCPTKATEGVSHFLCQTGFVGDLKVGTLSFLSEQTHEYLVVKEVMGRIEGENFSEAISLYFGGDIFAQNIPRSEQASFEFKGSMMNFWTPEGKLNREGLALDGELDLNLLPVRQLTEIFPMDGETRELIQAILGELLNARIDGRISQLSGPLTIDVKSSNFKAILPIMVHPHVIHLRDKVVAEITLTEAVNHTMIKDINPLLIAGAYSDHPLKVYLDPEGFSIPIAPYSLRAVQIAKATVDIGRIRVRNGGQIQLLMNFVKAQDITPEGEMDAWFTPIFMSLKEGVASYNRFDALLAGRVHTAMWGSINLINNQVRMTLGIDATTLQKRFNIKGLKANEMFQIKMGGTTEKLDLDWSAATTRITFLVAKTAGGPIGQLVGGILESIAPALGEEPTPPPTTTPLPWER